MKWLKHNWIFLALAFVAAVAMTLFTTYWGDPNRLTALGSLFGFILTIVLVAFTVVYVRTNQSTLSLLQEQWKAQNAVEVKFGLRTYQDGVQVWILNYGRANFVLEKVVIKMLGEEPKTVYKNSVLAPAEKKRYDLAHREWGRTLHLLEQVEITIFCESSTNKFQDSKVYTLHVQEGSRVFKVRKGLRGVWPVSCPKCGKFDFMCMLTDGLETFEAASERQAEMEAALVTSCPQHASKWMLTMENARVAESGDIGAIDC